MLKNKFILFILIASIVLISTASVTAISSMTCKYDATRNRNVCTVISYTKPVMTCKINAVGVDGLVIWKCIVKDMP